MVIETKVSKLSIYCIFFYFNIVLLKYLLFQGLNSSVPKVLTVKWNFPKQKQNRKRISNSERTFRSLDGSRHPGMVQSGVNFINVLRSNFLYKHQFDSLESGFEQTFVQKMCAKNVNENVGRDFKLTPSNNDKTIYILFIIFNKL